MRLAHGLTAGGEPSIGLTIVSRPDATDDVVDASGVDVFVDHAAADAPEPLPPRPEPDPAPPIPEPEPVPRA